MGKVRVYAYSSEIAKKVFRDGYKYKGVPISAKRVGTHHGKRVYEVIYRKSRR